MSPLRSQAKPGAHAMLPLDPSVWMSPWLDWTAALTIAAFFPTALWHQRREASSQ